MTNNQPNDEPKPENITQLWPRPVRPNQPDKKPAARERKPIKRLKPKDDQPPPSPSAA